MGTWKEERNWLGERVRVDRLDPTMTEAISGTKKAGKTRKVRPLHRAEELTALSDP